MKDKVYLFGAYVSVRQDGQKGWGNFIFEFTSMPSYEDLKQEIKKRNNGFEDLAIINLQFLTKEQFYALKGGKPDNPQSELLDKKVTELNLSVRASNICLLNGLKTVRDVCRITKTDYLKFRNSGKKSLSEIDNFLKENGLTWGMNV